MAKKIIVAPAKKTESVPNKQLVDAIITVKNLQEYIERHGGVEPALEAVNKVRRLVELTGGFDALTEALRIVGGDASEPNGSESPCE